MNEREREKLLKLYSHPDMPRDFEEQDQSAARRIISAMIDNLRPASRITR
jgi:hypothetical protein